MSDAPALRSHNLNRRDFISGTAALALSACSSEQSLPATTELFGISLAQWSVNQRLFGRPFEAVVKEFGFDQLRVAFRNRSRQVLKGDLTTLDFPALARTEFGIDAVEYVNTFFFDKARDETYLGELRKRADDAGVKSLLIMCDQEGRLGDPDPALRQQSFEDHQKWIDAAAFLGCHAVRVNAYSEGSPEEQLRLVAEGLNQLCDYADRSNIDVLIENHGGLSSNGQWVASLMRATDHPRVGTLPDFGNFNISPTERYDPYQGVAEMMPFARAVSAKSFDFDDEGLETTLDYHRLMRTVLDAGYRGYVGIEYEGTRLDEMSGIRATKRLLEMVRAELAEEHA